MSKNNTQRAFVLGIDGVPWGMLHEWSRDGELPNFQRLLEEGAAGPLQSTKPPTTPLAWPSIATGTRPDKHGIYGFHRLEGGYTHRMYTGDDLSRAALWDILTPAVIGNVPMTYPAAEIDGTMVSGMITPEKGDGFTFPHQLSDEVEREIPEYQIELDWYEYSDDRNQFLEDVDELLNARRRLMHLLARNHDWRLFFFVYTAPDRLQHLYWDEDVILAHYRRLDSVIGEALEYVEDNDATLYVVSDHGFGPISTFVNLNTLLADRGYLTRKSESGTRGTLSKLGVTKESVLDTLDRIGVTADALVRHVPKRVVDGVAGHIPGDHGLYDVDFDETVAFAHDPSQIYINDSDRFDRGIVSPEDIESVKRDVATTMSNVTDPKTGERALEVYDGGRLFPTDPDSPDLIAVGRNTYEEKTKIADEAFVPADHKAAGHRSDGVFFAWGPNVAPEVSVENATVFDIAPTVLYGAGEPIPSETDGRVLTEIFSSPLPESDAIESRRYEGSASDRTTSSGEDFDDVEDRLRGLGYLD